MKTSDATATAMATAGRGPAVDGSADGNVLSRLIQGVQNRISAWWQPGEPMFDFADDYFEEFAAASRDMPPLGRSEYDSSCLYGEAANESIDFKALLRITEPTSSDDHRLPLLTPKPLSAVHLAVLALSTPGLGNILGPVVHSPAGQPRISHLDPCKVLCLPGADAGLVVQRRVDWAPSRLLSRAVTADKPKINGLASARDLVSAPGSPTFLADATTWSDDIVSRLAVKQLEAFMGALPRDKWSAYLKLRTDIRMAAAAISRDFQARVTAWEDECVVAINEAIKAATGPQPDGLLDCQTAWLHTDYR
jgi:hypothetical protein